VDTRGHIHRDKAEGFRELGSVDVQALVARVAALPESYWHARNASKPNRFDTLGNTAHIVMKFVHRPAEPTSGYTLPEWALWREAVEPILLEAARRCGLARAEFPRVMLARLPAGGEISRHRDGGWYPAFCRKLHLPLITNPETRFFVEPEWRHLPVGGLVEVNNNAPHGVRNAGSTARVHLIFELFESPLDIARHPFVGRRRELGGDTEEGAAAV
jgi:hypothetical protein